MEGIQQYRYLPIIKTTDAELRGYEHLKEEVKDQVLPVFELTKSRKSKFNQNATVEKRIDSLKEIVGDYRPFILDITSHEDLSNDEIDSFANESHGFANWCEFVESFKPELNLIPVLHILPEAEGKDDEVKQQIVRLGKTFNEVAFRYCPFDFIDEDDYMTDEEMFIELKSYISLIKSSIDIQKLILIIDVQYVDLALLRSKVKTVQKLLQIFEDESLRPGVISIASSSFPAFVIGHEDSCHDDKGVLTIVEKQFFKQVCADSPCKKLVYGDYASIHPFRRKQAGGNWVPRIDYPLSEKIIYKRYRRDVGGYVRCAKIMVEDSLFIENINPCWGFDQIVDAASSNPKGKSPSFWISVRLNLFISKLIMEGELPVCHS